ncbi:hypothetical protein D9M68_713190 [compost metagenome]
MPVQRVAAGVALAERAGGDVGADETQLADHPAVVFQTRIVGVVEGLAHHIGAHRVGNDVGVHRAVRGLLGREQGDQVGDQLHRADLGIVTVLQVADGLVVAGPIEGHQRTFPADCREVCLEPAVACKHRFCVVVVAVHVHQDVAALGAGTLVRAPDRLGQELLQPGLDPDFAHSAMGWLRFFGIGGYHEHVRRAGFCIESALLDPPRADHEVVHRRLLLICWGNGSMRCGRRPGWRIRA